MAALTVALASDHAGFGLKSELAASLAAWGHEVRDLGPADARTVDYTDMADCMASCLADGEAAYGVLVCGTGIGISIAANRYRHVRAALCHDTTSARLARQHNDANVLAMGGRLICPQTARACLEVFLGTAFEGGRHKVRVDKLSRGGGLR